MKPLAASRPPGARRALFGVAGVAIALAVVQPAEAQDDRLQTFDIPAQSASASLLRLCLAAGCELAFAHDPDVDRRTRPVRGRMTWRAAAARMLDDTGLQYRFIGARGLRVWSAPQGRLSRPHPAPFASIEPVEVESVIVLGRLSDQLDESLR